MIHKGLVHALLLDKKGGAKEFIYSELPFINKKEGLLWVHFDYSSQEARDWILDKSGIVEVAAEALLMEETRPRTTILDDAILLTLRGVNLNPNSDPEDMVSIRLFVSENLIISTKKRDLLSVDEMVSDLKNNNGVKSSAEFLTELTYRLTSRLQDTIDEIQDRADFIEENIFESNGSKLRSQMLDIRKESVILKRYLFPQREAMNKLFHDKISWINEYQKIELREITDQLIRHIEELDTIREKIALIQEELANNLSEQLNKRMYVLSIISVIFLPLTFLTGLLGINVGGIPGANDENAFFIFVGLLSAILVVSLLFFRKKRWI